MTEYQYRLVSFGEGSGVATFRIMPRVGEHVKLAVRPGVVFVVEEVLHEDGVDVSPCLYLRELWGVELAGISSV